MQGRNPFGENAEATNGTVAREKQWPGTRESRRPEAGPGIAKSRLLLEGKDRLDVLDTEALQGPASMPSISRLLPSWGPMGNSGEMT